MVRSSLRTLFGSVPLVLSLGIVIASLFAVDVRAQSPTREILPVQGSPPAMAELAALKEAREIYAQARKKAEQSLHLAIEGQIVDSAGAGNHDETRRLRILQEVLRQTHQPPEGTGLLLQPAIDRYLATMRVADRFLDSYYSEALGVLSREKLFEEANLIATERNLWKGLPVRPADRPPVAIPPAIAAGSGAGTKMSPAATAGSPAAPMGPSMPPGTASQMISLQAPSIEATNPAPDLEVISAIWTVDPRFVRGDVSKLDVTELVRRQLKADRVVVASAVFGELKGASIAKCLELTLRSEGGLPFVLRLHEGSEVVARELTPPLDKTNARPIRGTTLMLMLASWGLRDEERGTSVGAEYAARFDKGKNVAASTALFGELTFGKPKVLRTLWRVGQTLLYVKQAENSEVVVEDLAPETPKTQPSP